MMPLARSGEGFFFPFMRGRGRRLVRMRDVDGGGPRMGSRTSYRVF